MTTRQGWPVNAPQNDVWKEWHDQYVHMQASGIAEEYISEVIGPQPKRYILTYDHSGNILRRVEGTE